MAQPTRSSYPAAEAAAVELGPYWAHDASRLLGSLATTREGLSSTQAAEHLRRFGRNSLRERRLSWARVLFNQVKSPLVMLLVFAAVASAFTGEWADASIVLGIVLVSVAM